MHDKIDAIFKAIWNAVPDSAPVWVEYPVYKLEYLLHRLASLFEKNEDWQ